MWDGGTDTYVHTACMRVPAVHNEYASNSLPML